jgi:hypothetical protein
MKRNMIKLVCLGILLLMMNGTFAQTTKDWEDGTEESGFTITTPLIEHAVSFTDTVTKEAIGLTPKDSLVVDDTLNVKLDGVDWKWPTLINIGSAQDIDYRNVGSQDLYMVVDASARKIIEYNLTTETVTWEYGSTEPSNSQYLDRPVDAYLYRDVSDNNFKVLVTDQTNHRVVKVNQTTKTIEWFFGKEGQEGNTFDLLSNPEDAIKVPGEDQFIIADGGNDRVLLVDEGTRSVLWYSKPGVFNNPADVEYSVADSAILVTDKGKSRIALISPEADTVFWQFPPEDNTDNDKKLSLPSDADILPNGNILIADEGNTRLIEVDRSHNIVWKFNGAIGGLKDADRLLGNKHLVVNFDEDFSSIRPLRLGYTTDVYVSKIYDLDSQVLFDKIFWEAQAEGEGTSIRFQIRSATSLSGLEVAEWYGPESGEEYFEESNIQTNSVHNGDRFYQFKAELNTTEPLYTPVLTTFGLNYKLYPTGIGLQSFISQSFLNVHPDNMLVTKWKTLEFNTIIPDDPVLQEQIYMKIEIRMIQHPYSILATVEASQSDANNKFNLESYTELQGKQDVYLFGKMSTTNSSVTPIIKNWKITYEVIEADTSKLYFADENGDRTNYYSASSDLTAEKSYGDSVDVHLVDANLQAFQDSMLVTVQSMNSGDSEDILLWIDETNVFSLVPKLSMEISDSITPNNNKMEVFDRDTLKVEYIDPNNADDKAEASLLVVQFTDGNLQIVDSNKNQITQEVDFGKALYLYVSGENDKNYNANVQDSIIVKIFDRTTNDEEFIALAELPGGNGSYDTGNFINTEGIVVRNSNNGIPGDNKIQALPGHIITAEYTDKVTKTASVLVKRNPATILDLGGEVYIAEVAPNPFYERLHDNFRMRVASTTGDLRVRLLEIYSIAGEKVKEIDGITLDFDLGPTVPKERYGVADYWWDLKNESGQQISSGTYFVKVHADLFNSDQSNVESVTYLRKFVIVR